MTLFNPLKNKWTAWILWLLWGAMVLKFSSESGAVSSGKSGWLLGQITYALLSLRIDVGNAELLHTLIRKAAHMLNYGCFGLISLNALRLSVGRSRVPLWAAALLLMVAFASFDEYFQTFIPGRSGQIQDVFIDAAGVAVGLLLYFIIRKESLWDSSKN